MNASLAPSAAPTHCLHVWSDGIRIYVEIPGTVGKDAYVTTYPFDSRGVNLMLSLLGLHRVDYDYPGTIPDSYLKGPGDNHQRAQAEVTLRQMGIIQPHKQRRS